MSHSKFPSVFILFYFMFSISGFSQNVKIDTFNASFGMDASFINTFLPFDNTIGDRGNYLFHYIKYKEDKRFTRHAVNIDILGRFSNSENSPDFDDSRFVFDYKMSKGKKREVFKNGHILYGGEFLAGYFLNNRVTVDQEDMTGNSFITNSDQDIEIAIGPFLGLEFKISPRISLYTEAAIYLKGKYSLDRFSSDLTPSLNFTDTVLQIDEQFSLPGAIILFYSFNN